jgi:hypothetical protein
MTELKKELRGNVKKNREQFGAMFTTQKGLCVYECVCVCVYV